MVELKDKPGESVTPAALKYVNRLSDFLFVAARYVNDKGARDVLWVPGAEPLKQRTGVPPEGDQGGSTTRSRIVTGAASGIGRASAILFAREGAPVDRRSECGRLAETAKLIARRRHAQAMPPMAAAKRTSRVVRRALDSFDASM